MTHHEMSVGTDAADREADDGKRPGGRDDQDRDLDSDVAAPYRGPVAPLPAARADDSEAPLEPPRRAIGFDDGQPDETLDW